jgi:hypothetical protein
MGISIVELFVQQLEQASCSGLMDLLNEHYDLKKQIPTQQLIQALVLSINHSDQTLFNFLVSMPKVLAQPHANRNTAIHLASLNPNPYYLSVLLGINAIKKHIGSHLNTILSNAKKYPVAHKENIETLLALQKKIEQPRRSQKPVITPPLSPFTVPRSHAEVDLNTLVLMLKSKVTIGQTPSTVDDSHYFPLIFNDAPTKPKSTPPEFQYRADEFPSLSSARVLRQKQK